MKNTSPFEQEIGQRLQDSPIDPATRERLRQSRRVALDALESPPGRFLAPSLVQGLAFAGVAALALLLVLTLNQKDSRPPADSLIAFEIVTSDAPLEFYEDLEFYDWLAQQDPNLG